LIGFVVRQATPQVVRHRDESDGDFVLDVIYVAAIVGLFALVALIARGVEKL